MEGNLTIDLELKNPEILPKNFGSNIDALMYSGSYEWYTPVDIVDRARRVMGNITLDPASSPLANETVRAEKIFTVMDNGLLHDWTGSVWMNPPYGAAIGSWVEKLVAGIQIGKVERAIVLLPARTDTAWFRKMVDWPRCFIWGRLKFDGPRSNNFPATFPSVVLMHGCDLGLFTAEFSEIGDVYLRHPALREVVVPIPEQMTLME